MNSLPLPRAPYRLGAALRAALWGAGLVALALLLVRAPLSWAALAVAGGVGGLALLLRPSLGLLALAFAVPFGSLREISVGGLAVGASELLVAAALGAWLLQMAATRRVRVVRTRFTAGLLVFLAALTLALLPARALPPAVKELAKWVELLVVFTIVASALSRLEARLLVAALLLAGAAQALLGLYQFLFQVGPPGFVLMGRYMRAYGTFQQPNPFGGYMGLLLPLAYCTAVLTWRDVAAAKPGQRVWAWAYWLLAALAAVLLGAGLVASWSRGGLVGAMAGVALVLLALGRRVWIVVGLGAVVLGVAGPDLLALLPGDLLGRVTETFTYLDGRDLTAIEITDANFSVVERVAHWLAAWRMFERSPWLGVGVGQYAVVYPEVALPRWQDPLGHAHNYYLNILAEAGLLGLGAYLLMLWMALGSAWTGARRAAGWQRALALGALGMLGHLLAHSVFDNLYVHEMYLVVAMLLGLVAWSGAQPEGVDADRHAE